MLIDMYFKYEAEILKKRCRKSVMVDIKDSIPIEFMDISEEQAPILLISMTSYNRLEIYREINGEIYSMLQYGGQSMSHVDVDSDVISTLESINMLANKNHSNPDFFINPFTTDYLNSESSHNIQWITQKTNSNPFDMSNMDEIKLWKSDNKDAIIKRLKKRFEDAYVINGCIYTKAKLPDCGIVPLSKYEPYHSQIAINGNSYGYTNFPLTMLPQVFKMDEGFIDAADMYSFPLSNQEPQIHSTTFVIPDMEKIDSHIDVGNIIDTLAELISLPSQEYKKYDIALDTWIEHAKSNKTIDGFSILLEEFKRNIDIRCNYKIMDYCNAKVIYEQVSSYLMEVHKNKMMIMRNGEDAKIIDNLAPPLLSVR